MKKHSVIILGFMLTALIAAANGCGNSGGQDSSNQAVVETSSSTESNADASGEAADTGAAATEESKEQGEALKPEEIYEKIKAAYTLPEMYEADADWLMNYYGIDANMLSGYVFAEADEVHADRVIILTVAEEGNVSEVEEKLKAVYGQLSSQEMLDYLPDQADIITSASIKKKGNTLYLVISPDAEGIEEIITKSLLGE